MQKRLGRAQVAAGTVYSSNAPASWLLETAMKYRQSSLSWHALTPSITALSRQSMAQRHLRFGTAA